MNIRSLSGRAKKNSWKAISSSFSNGRTFIENPSFNCASLGYSSNMSSNNMVCSFVFDFRAGSTRYYFWLCALDQPCKQAVSSSPNAVPRALVVPPLHLPPSTIAFTFL